MQLDDLLKIDFSGGTLIEYEMYSGFSKEWQRAKVIKVGLEIENNSEYFHIETDGEAMYKCIMENVGKGHIESVEDNVYYIDSGPYLGIRYALAPKGVNIPTPSERMRKYEQIR